MRTPISIVRVPEGIYVRYARNQRDVVTVRVAPLAFTAADLAWFRRPIGGAL